MSDQEWIENTWENPFWRTESAVEIKTKDGQKRVLSCPKCAKSLMPYVAQWRKVAPAEAKKG